MATYVKRQQTLGKDCEMGGCWQGRLIGISYHVLYQSIFPVGGVSAIEVR
jgi:hypothetical protein